MCVYQGRTAASYKSMVKNHFKYHRGCYIVRGRIFYQLNTEQYILKCLHQGATVPLYPFDLPFFSSQPCKVMICSRHIMTLVRDINIAEALIMLCLLTYCVMKRDRYCRNRGIMVFTYRDMGCAFHEYILRIFCNGWMDCRVAFHAVLCLYCCVMDKT